MRWHKKTIRAVNTTRGTLVGESIRVAETGLTRIVGLLGERELPPGDGLLIVPSQGVHTLGMQFAIDVAFLGIGENGHIAFNDPPADFDIEDPYIIVALDHACRAQQVAEGWFENLDSVPRQAVSMSVRQVLRATEILAVVPGPRKAAAIKACFDGPISPMAPSSILRTHPNATVYLDLQSSALLSPATLSAHTASA